MKRYILLTALLAVICIGGVELWVCSYQAPELYNAITAPVRAAARRLGELGELAWDNLSQAVSAAVSDASSRAREGLRRLAEALKPEPELPDQEIQLVDDGTVAPPPRAPAPYTVTALNNQDGQKYLTGGAQEFFYFNQTDEAWAQEAYGSDHIGGYGCGPTAMAMVVSSLTGSPVDPVQMAQHCVDHGYWAKKHGSYWSIVPGTAKDFGLTCISLPPEETTTDSVSQHLSSGALIVALIGPSHFTNGGHFIVLRGITLDGSILVADSASEERSLTTWDLDLILEELPAGRSSGGPLWVIYPDPYQ